MSSEPVERSLMAAVNVEIDRLHGSLGLTDTDFFCECGHIACKERITVSRADYASLREKSRPLVVPNHVNGRAP